MFVFGDMLVFALFFGVYAYYRALDHEAFQTAQTAVDQDLGAFNTLLLLLSSWFVVLALADAREHEARFAPRLFLAALGCGMGFVVVKGVEYAELLTSGVGITTNDFFTYYFIFTGLHLVHLLIGLGVLVFLIGWVRKRGSGRDDKFLESGCIYWHMVDLLWIVLFPLLYLMP